jgi:hypothetical protein
MLDARDHLVAVRIEQRQQELVVELHHRRLVGLGAQHPQDEIECGLRPAMRQVVEIELCRPDAAGLIATADALQRAPHRRQFAERQRIEKRLGLVGRAQLRCCRDGLKQCRVFTQPHHSHSSFLPKMLMLAATQIAASSD